MQAAGSGHWPGSCGRATSDAISALTADGLEAASHDRSALLHPAVRAVLGLSLSSRIERGYLVATLSGELDIAAAPIAREKLLAMLAPAPSRLAIDLSAVSYADATGLAVLVATDRRARLLGGLLRLAAPSPEVANVLSITGLNRHLEIFATIHAAITSPPGSRCRHDSTSRLDATQLVV